jgi:signal transduction histidine kinase
VADDFARLVSLACHDLRTPLATVQGFAKTLLQMDVDADKRVRYLTLIDHSADDLASLLDLLSLVARIESGRYDPTLQEADSRRLAPDGATGTGTVVRVDPEPVTRALAALARAASRHGGVEVAVAVDGADVRLAPVVAAAAPVVLGEEQKDLGAAVAVWLLRALRAEVALDGETLTVTLPTT